MQQFQEVFCFLVDDHRFVLALHQVERVIHAVAIHPVPDSSPIVYGLVDYHGKVVPVLNFRYRSGLDEKPLGVNDFLILAITSKRKFFIIATDVQGIIEIPGQDIISSSDLDSGIGASGVFRRDDGIFFIYDLEKFMTSDEGIELDQVIDKNR